MLKPLLVLVAWSKIASADVGTVEAEVPQQPAVASPQPQPQPAPPPQPATPTPQPQAVSPEPQPHPATPPQPAPHPQPVASAPQPQPVAPVQAVSAVNQLRKPVEDLTNGRAANANREAQKINDNISSIVAPSAVLGTLLGYLNPGVAVGCGVALDSGRIDSATIITEGDTHTVRVSKSPRITMHYLLTGQYPVVTRGKIRLNAVVGINQHANVSLGVNVQVKRSDSVGLTLGVLVSPRSVERLADGFMANTPTKESSVRTSTDTGVDVIFTLGIAHWK
jgi:hypothetical protein